MSSFFVSDNQLLILIAAQGFGNLDQRARDIPSKTVYDGIRNEVKRRFQEDAQGLQDKENHAWPSNFSQSKYP